MKDNVVSEIYESTDYDKFTILPENRGRKETNGIKITKLKNLNELHEREEYIDEWALVRVNKAFQIIDGRHTFEDRKARKMPIRYEIIKNEKFNNGHTKRELMSAIFLVNKNSTAWTGDDFYKSNLQNKAPLATRMNEVIERYGNTFKWTDLLALLTKNEEYFTGRFKSIHADVFDDKKLIKIFDSNEFYQELKFFVKLNEKGRVAYRKSNFLKACYLIINKAKIVVDPKAFRRYIINIEDKTIEGHKTKTVGAAIKTCIEFINTQNGKTYRHSAVMFEIKNQVSIMKNTKHGEYVEQEEEEVTV